jgi:hypothetical protein
LPTTSPELSIRRSVRPIALESTRYTSAGFNFSYRPHTCCIGFIILHIISAVDLGQTVDIAFSEGTTGHFLWQSSKLWTEFLIVKYPIVKPLYVVRLPLKNERVGSEICTFL